MISEKLGPPVADALVASEHFGMQSEKIGSNLLASAVTSGAVKGIRSFKPEIIGISEREQWKEGAKKGGGKSM
jgi:hypothetical protein